MADYVWWRGGRFDENSLPSLKKAESLAGLPIRVTQGGYNAGRVGASAGTHDGGAVIDISTYGWNSAQIWHMLTWLRRCGWAAWFRSPAQGFTPHIHAVRIEDASASWAAKQQVVAYRNGRNGLANNRADDGPNVRYITWADSPYNPANQTSAVKKIVSLSAAEKAMKAGVLCKGAGDNDGQQIQRALNNRVAGTDLLVDGILGPRTKRKYAQFQAGQYGVKVGHKDATGIPGKDSLERLGFKVVA